MVFDDLPGFKGMSSFQLVERFAGAFDQVFAAGQERVDDVPDSDIANALPDRIAGFDDGVEHFDNGLPIADDNRSTESPHTFASLFSSHGYLLGVLVDFARLPARLRNSAFCTCFFEGRVDGVFFFETTFDGRQYWLLASPEWPQGFPVALSTHFSFAQRRSDLPALPLRTLPFDLRHLATACDARADGHTRYWRLIFLVHASSAMTSPRQLEVRAVVPGEVAAPRDIDTELGGRFLHVRAPHVKLFLVVP